MKKRLQNPVMHPIKMLSILCILFANFTFAQNSPQREMNKLRQFYNRIHNPEISFEKFVQNNSHTNQIRTKTKASIGNFVNTNLSIGASCSKVRLFCTNGDFESGLDTAEWLGAYGIWGSGDPDPASLTDGFISGSLNDFDAHQTIVSTGTDPTTGIPLPAPNGGTQALRLGNQVNGFGTELIGKTITVTAAQTIFSFMYAVVFEDPGHQPLDQPAFSVRVFDCATGQELSGVVDLGNGSYKVISDASNPFFQDTIASGFGPIAYRNWSSAQINLSAYVGKTVTIYFTNKDCGQGGHFGYTYLDNFCVTAGPCPPNVPCPGFIAFDSSRVDTCGAGGICVKYGLPRIVQGNTTTTGNITIDLDIYQNGTKLQTISSPTLSQDSLYCFSIDPASLSLVDSLGGFDYVITGRFSIGTTNLAPQIAGNNGPPNGQIPGQNNDYKINCGSTSGTTTQCCPGANLVANPGFEQGNTGFTSNYTYQPLIALSSVLPGYYTIANSAQALTISPSWNVNCPSNGNHLLINGLTTGMAPHRYLVWKQKVTVEYGKKYKFCANLKNLPQIGFDVKPFVFILFRNASGQRVDSVSKAIDVPADSCNWDLIEKQINLPSVGSGTTTLTISIFIDESSLGDGNDLAIDNISLIEMKPVSVDELLFNVSFINITGNKFGISADPIAPLGSNCTSNWEVSEIDSNYRKIPGTEVVNPSLWAKADPNTFNGYVGISTLGDTTKVGIFQFNKRYRIVYSRTCECAATNSFTAIIDPIGSRGNLHNIRIMADPASNSIVKSTSSTANRPVNELMKENNILEKSFDVYPNPANNNLTVAFNKVENKAQLIIYNATGNIVKETNVRPGNNRTDINIKTLSPGTYFIKLFTNNKISSSKVFVKQ